MEAWNKKFQPVGSVFPEGGREGGKKKAGEGGKRAFHRTETARHPPTFPNSASTLLRWRVLIVVIHTLHALRR